MRVYLGSDHAGFELKAAIISWLGEAGHEAVDCGPASYDPQDDYPVYVMRAAASVAALLALGNGLLLAMANAVSYDLYYKSWHLTAPGERRLLVARGAILIVAALAAAWYGHRNASLALWAASLLALLLLFRLHATDVLNLVL